MKRRKLSDALNEISDKHIAEAAGKKKRRVLPWLGAIAAVLAVVILLSQLEIPLAIRAKAVSTASASRTEKMPDLDDYDDSNEWRAANEAWAAARDARSAVAETALTQLDSFLTASCAEFLSGADGNRLYSPVNAYIGLAVAAELARGNTQQQLLTLLGADDTAALRSQVSAVWESVYKEDGKELCVLASSLWLDSGLTYDQKTMDVLAHDYYASVYQQGLSSKQAVKDIQAWLNNNTGGKLRGYVDGVQLPEEAVLALYSTIYFQSMWGDEFRAANNTDGVFHAPAGDTQCTYMNAKLRQMNYYWGDSFGAVALRLKNGSTMWFILPDADKTIDDVLSEGQYMELVTDPYEEWENSKYMKVNLSIPKFDISAQTDLRSGLEKLGVTDLFDMEKADFSGIYADQAYMTAANQAVRVAIDEQGVTAVAYIELPGAGAAAPPEGIIDFILDRPFLFVITGSNNIPLFAGAVNQP